MPDIPSGIVIVCDGGCFHNQNADKRQAYGSIAVFVNGQRKTMHYNGLDGAHETRQARIEFGPITNNQAEFRTVLVALGYVRELYGRSVEPAPITIISDSELVVNSALGINKKFKVAEIAALAGELKEKLALLPLVKLEHRSREVVCAVLGH